MTIKSELLELSARNRKLTTSYVVDWAKQHTSSAIYSALEWDDKIAARKYREWQVRQLIGLYVYDDVGDRQLVSLSIDRDIGGYRSVDSVMASPDLAEIMLLDAQNELVRVRSKYGRVKKLIDVWFLIDKKTGDLRKRKAAMGAVGAASHVLAGQAWIGMATIGKSSIGAARRGRLGLASIGNARSVRDRAALGRLG